MSIFFVGLKIQPACMTFLQHYILYLLLVKKCSKSHKLYTRYQNISPFYVNRFILAFANLRLNSDFDYSEKFFRKLVFPKISIEIV